MKRIVDVQCHNQGCGYVKLNVFLDEDDLPICSKCRGPAEQKWWGTTSHNAEWSDADAVVVFRKPDGSFSFPAVNNKPTPDGWERITAKSDRQVAQLEKITNTLNHNRHFDSNGRGFDDEFRGKRYS